MINGKQILIYSDVSAALINYEVRRQDKLSSYKGTSVEALAIEAGVPIGRTKVIMGDQSPDQISEI